jgi:DNA-binding NarL/FixJ family response regulator
MVAIALWNLIVAGVIGEASNRPEATQKTAELLPDVVIIDLRVTARGERKHTLSDDWTAHGGDIFCGR